MIEAFLALRNIHRMFEEAAAQLQEGIGVPTCMPRCGLCCMHNTPTWTTIEAIHATSVLTGQGRLTKMLSLAEGWLTEKNPKLTLYEGIPHGWASPKLIEERQTVFLSQCPFLSGELGCMIYEVRPLSCRAFAITRDALEMCPRPRGKGESPNLMMVVDGTPIKQAIDRFKHDCLVKNRVWLVSGHVPTLLYRVAEPEKFKLLALDGKAPSAKLLGTETDTSLMWQPQVEALRAGMNPNLVVEMAGPTTVHVRGKR